MTSGQTRLNFQEILTLSARFRQKSPSIHRKKPGVDAESGFFPLSYETIGIRGGSDSMTLTPPSSKRKELPAVFDLTLEPRGVAHGTGYWIRTVKIDAMPDAVQGGGRGLRVDLLSADRLPRLTATGKINDLNVAALVSF